MNTKPACKQTGYAPQKPTRFLALVANSVINHLTSAAGRGVSRTAGGVTTSFLYDGGSVLLEKQGGTTTATYTYGNALIRKDGETPLFDGLGSERTVTNSSQSVTASLTLSAFGQTVASTGSSTSAYQFGATSGYRTEGDVGLTLVGCRFYDAQVGRFITRDTYLNQKPYAYCDGDPVNATDPSGHMGVFNPTIPVRLITGIFAGAFSMLQNYIDPKLAGILDPAPVSITYPKGPGNGGTKPPTAPPGGGGSPPPGGGGSPPPGEGGSPPPPMGGPVGESGEPIPEFPLTPIFDPE